MILVNNLSSADLIHFDLLRLLSLSLSLALLLAIMKGEVSKLYSIFQSPIGKTDKNGDMMSA